MRVPWRTGLDRASRASQALGRTRAVRRREVLRPSLFVNASFRANGFRCSSRACKAASCATRATCAVTCPFSACDGRATCATTSVRVVRDGASRNKLARRSRKRRSRSRRTAHRGERRSMPPHARAANARSSRVFVSSRSPRVRSKREPSAQMARFLGQVSRSCVSASKTRKRAKLF